MSKYLGRCNGSLTVIEDLGIKQYPGYRKRLLRCSCICGNTVELMASNLTKQESCAECGNLRNRSRRITHGLSHTQIWNTHHGMIQRCNNPNTKAFPRYGGRGITVCDEWVGPGGFEKFVADMGLPPSPKHSIGRVDNDRGYRLDNCEWQTDEQQNRNTSQNRLIRFRGAVKTLVEWSEITGVSEQLLRSRFSQGITGDKLFCTSDLRLERNPSRDPITGKFSAQ